MLNRSVALEECELEELAELLVIMLPVDERSELDFELRPRGIQHRAERRHALEEKQWSEYGFHIIPEGAPV